MAMEGWANLGSILAGGARQDFNRGMTRGAQAEAAMAEARKAIDNELGRRMMAHAAEKAGDHDRAFSILQGAGENWQQYQGGQSIGQIMSLRDEAAALARAPGTDSSELNQLLMAAHGQPSNLTAISGNVAYNPLVTPDAQTINPTEIGLSEMMLNDAQAGASRASAASSYASAARSRAGIGSDKASNYELITTPNGIVRANKLTGEVAPLVGEGGVPVMPKPTARGGGAMPAAGLKLQQEEIDAINAAENVTSSLQTIQGNLAGGELDLGPIDNLSSQFLNATGMSTPNSRNYASMMATLEKARNDSLRLNKGVQTEGDAQRAWNELIANVRDPELVRQRIDEINALNQRAIQQRRMNVDLIRQNFGAGPVDLMDAFGGEPAQSAPIAAPAAPSAGPLGMGYEVGEVITVGGRQYRVVGGDPTDPELEEL